MNLELYRSSRHSTIRGVNARDFTSPELTRGGTKYNLPFWDRSLAFSKISYDSILGRKLTILDHVKLLDIGCGGGIWLADQALKSDKIECFGITAKDYRLPEQRVRTARVTVNTPEGLLEAFDMTPVVTDPISKQNLCRLANIDDRHYYVGEACTILSSFASNSMDIVVSHQSFKYFFDPLRALKHTYRVLREDGFAFIEAPGLRVYDSSTDKMLTSQNVEDLFRIAGLNCMYGDYSSDGLNVRTGILIIKRKPHIRLPLIYKSVVYNRSTMTNLCTYALK